MYDVIRDLVSEYRFISTTNKSKKNEAWIIDTVSQITETTIVTRSAGHCSLLVIGI